VPGVHVTAQLTPGPPGRNPTIVLVNPTDRGVYSRCTVVILGRRGRIIFRGDLPSTPSGLYAPPGRFVEGSGALEDDMGRSFDFTGQRYRTSCTAFVWRGMPPV
jgi:hypothetical protein